MKFDMILTSTRRQAKIVSKLLKGVGVLGADDINMLGENSQTIRQNTEIFIKASKNIGLEVNSENTKYMITSRYQNVIQNQNVVIGNLSFENVEKYRYLGVTVTNTMRFAKRLNAE